MTRSVGALALAGFAVGVQGQVLTLGSPASDAEFAQLLNDGVISETFVAEGRGGNNALNGDFEAALLDSFNNNLPVSTDQMTWPSAQSFDFAINWDGTTLQLAIAQAFVETTDFAGRGVDALYIRTRAQGSSEIELRNMFFSSGAGNLSGFSLSSDGSGPVNYLTISGFENAFSLSGIVTMTYADVADILNSRTAFQVKAIVPAPATAALGVLGLAGVARRRRSRL